MYQESDYRSEIGIYYLFPIMNHGVGFPGHFQESDFSMLYYLSHSHFT